MKFTLKELRARKDKNLKTVAKELGIAYTTYQRWEKNPSKIDAGKLARIANYYGVTLDEIFLP